MGADLFGQLYDTIALDPPWAENGGGQCKRGADRHYPTVALKDMPALILNSGVWRPNPAACNVWCWTTANFLDGAVWLFGLLGVHYVSNIVWAKVKKDSDTVPCEELDADDIRIGLGQHFRLAHEHLLYGRIGSTKVPSPENRMPTLVPAAPLGHSVKPERFRTIMEKHDGPGRKLEMFARSPAPGWDCWGPHEGLEVANG